MAYVKTGYWKPHYAVGDVAVSIIARMILRAAPTTKMRVRVIPRAK